MLTPPQLGSLLKVVSKLKDVKAAANAAEVIQGHPMTVNLMLTLLDNVADQVDMDNEDDKTKINPKQTYPPSTPYPLLRVKGKSNRASAYNRQSKPRVVASNRRVVASAIYN